MSFRRYDGEQPGQPGSGPEGEPARSAGGADIAARIRALPALPVLCQHLLKRLNDPLLDFGSLAEQVKYDPGMTANVLRLANSAYFGSPREVGSLREAFVRIGSKRLFEMVIGAGAGTLLGEAFAGYELRRHELLQHSVWTAAAAENIAVELGLPAPDMVFTAGLLHDIGKIVLDPLVEARRAELAQVVRRRNPGVSAPARSGSDRLFPAVAKLPAVAPAAFTFEAAEREVLGMDHAAVGAAVLEKWALPGSIVVAVGCHHEPQRAPPEYRLLANLVHAANVLASTSGVGAGIAGLRHAVSEEAIGSLGLTTAILERVAGQTLSAMQELERLLGGASS